MNMEIFPFLFMFQKNKNFFFFIIFLINFFQGVVPFPLQFGHQIE